MQRQKSSKGHQIYSTNPCYYTAHTIDKEPFLLQVLEERPKIRGNLWVGNIICPDPLVLAQKQSDIELLVGIYRK